jgi:hypothetical protein
VIVGEILRREAEAISGTSGSSLRPRTRRWGMFHQGAGTIIPLTASNAGTVPWFNEGAIDAQRLAHASSVFGSNAVLVPLEMDGIMQRWLSQGCLQKIVIIHHQQDGESEGAVGSSDQSNDSSHSITGWLQAKVNSIEGSDIRVNVFRRGPWLGVSRRLWSQHHPSSLSSSSSSSLPSSPLPSSPLPVQP